MAIPYIHFQGNCRQAMSRYAEILGGTLELMPYSATPDAPPGFENSDLVMHSCLSGDEFGTLMASDYPPGMQGMPQASLSVTLITKDVERARSVFDALAEGGETIMPFAATFFAPGFGMARDRFGTAWMVMAEG